MEDIVDLISKGEEVELTADQMKTYFKNLSNHPKFDGVNHSTKYFHYLVRERIILHKEGVGDKGAKTIGKNTTSHVTQYYRVLGHVRGSLLLPFI